MKVPRAFCLLLLMSIVATQALAQEPTTKDILANLDKNAKTFTSLDTSVERIDTEFLFKAPAESGKLLVKPTSSGPRIFHEIEKPETLRKTVLIDNGKGTVYFRNTNSYMEKSVDPKSEVLQYLMLGFGTPAATLTKGYSADYKGRAMVNGVNTAILELTSASKVTSDFSKITLWLDPATWTPVQTRLWKTEKSFYDFKYSNVRLNKGVSDSVFKWSVPKDAKKQ